MSKIKFYYDFMSQPSRALWIILQMSKTPYDDCPVALRKMEHRSDAYKKINRFQKVPALVDGGFHLSESVAMLRYISSKGHISEKLYPPDIENRARVDEFLEWQHLTLCNSCKQYFMNLWFLPINGLAEMPTKEKINELKDEVENNLKVVEKIWLKDYKFLAGNNLTAADLFGATIIEQIRLCKYDVSEKFPKASDWLKRVREESHPFYDEGHKIVYKKAGFIK